MGVLAPRMRKLEGGACPPIDMSKICVSAHVCKVTFKHLPQPIRSHTQSFRTLGQPSPPLSAQIQHTAGGPRIF